jgi:hypothetical protein
VFDRLSFLVAHPAPSFFFFRPRPVLHLSRFPHLNLAIIFLSFARSLSRYTGTSSVAHLSYSLLYLDSWILTLFSCLSVSLSLSLSSSLIHLPSSLNLSTSSLAYPFLLQYFSLSFSSAFFFFSLYKFNYLMFFAKLTCSVSFRNIIIFQVSL